MTNATILRTISAAIAELPAKAKSRAALTKLATDLRTADKRRADYAARGRAAWATRRKAKTGTRKGR